MDDEWMNGEWPGNEKKKRMMMAIWRKAHKKNGHIFKHQDDDDDDEIQFLSQRLTTTMPKSLKYGHWPPFFFYLILYRIFGWTKMDDNGHYDYDYDDDIILM